MGNSRIRLIDCAILAAILILATVARVKNLDNSLWHDEIHTLMTYIRPPFANLLNATSSFNNHIFYSLQAKISVLLFGESNWSVRLPAVIFGIAGIAATWRLVHAVSGAWQAHICALFLALSYHHVWFSQNARGYTELMFWCVVSTIILMACLRNPSWKRWFAYGLVLAAGMFTHLTAGVFFLAQGIYVVATGIGIPGQAAATSGKERWLMPAMGFLVGTIITLLLYSASIGQIIEMVQRVPAASSVDVMKEYQSPIWAVLEILRTFGKSSLIIMPAAFVALIFTGIGIVSVAKREPLIPVVLILHIALMLIILLSLSMRIWPRFFFIDIGFILLFLTRGVFVCCQQIARMTRNDTVPKVNGKYLFILVSTAMIVFSIVLLERNYQWPKQDFESSIRYVQERRQQADKVFTVGLATAPYEKYYGMDWRGVKSKQELLQRESDPGNQWIVIIFPRRTNRKFPDIMDYVKRNFSLAKTFRGTLQDGEILIYSRNRQFAD